MGNASSQPDAGEYNGHAEDTDAIETHKEITSSPPTAIEKVRRDVQPASSKKTRKRKALSNSANDHAPTVAPLAPSNKPSARPIKRNKVAEPKQKPTDSPKAVSTGKHKGKTSNAPTRDANPAQEHAGIKATTGVAPESEPKSNAPPTSNEGEEIACTPEPARGSEKPSEIDAARPEFKKGKHGRDSVTGEPKLVGFFKPDEIQKLEKFKLNFCTSHGLSSGIFDLMVQHSERDKISVFPCHSTIITKPTFWKEVYKILPERERRSIYRFMRRHFQYSTQKPHKWTEEQDEELILLHERHGPKWAYIAKIVGRSDDDVVQRWKNRLEHRRTMNRGPWSEQEVRTLQELLQASWNGMQGSGHDIGRDIYEMDEIFIAWGQISDKMNNCRSRQQCADKWRKSNPDAFYDPAIETKQSTRRGKSRQTTPGDKQFKSAEFTESTSSTAPLPEKADKASSPARQTTALVKTKKLKPSTKSSAESDSTSEASDSSSDSASDSESNSDSEPLQSESRSITVTGTAAGKDHRSRRTYIVA
ncbi:hypothetical protein BO71DRAFT_454215 [Aspergillus ellipticus CBS 707.79]|uniref:MYB DNA-binding domain protein n=1 Tax=Aspergillus ellipticus CBS 707.79 TaxID=1448320 RepID=A0A319CTY4_9EURO|nr:hypothetical protein BO71DRAFT_454215 [Aspergillus ellipticus CBS 707.79]